MPPAKLLPRLVTLLLLLFAGLDLGMHRPGRLVRRVEPSLTRPWEHGAGGKVARMAGMMPSSSPTALPASFPGDVAAAGECVAGEYGSDGGGGSGGGIGGLGGNMDILGKVVDYAKNYAASTFPRTALVLGTLMKVMKVDMYVLLCGMLIGLAITPIEEDHSTGIGGSVVEAAGRLVLGDGEL